MDVEEAEGACPGVVASDSVVVWVAVAVTAAVAVAMPVPEDSCETVSVDVTDKTEESCLL